MTNVSRAPFFSIGLQTKKEIKNVINRVQTQEKKEEIIYGRISVSVIKRERKVIIIVNKERNDGEKMSHVFFITNFVLVRLSIVAFVPRFSNIRSF